MNICIIGCGNLGLSIVHGLLNNGSFEPADLTATKRNIDTLEDLKNKGVNVTIDNIKAVENADVVLVSVKPYNIESVLKEIGPHIKSGAILVSLATGINLDTLAEQSGNRNPVFRAMPNIATDIRESVTCISAKEFTQDQVDIIKNLFDHLGTTIYIEENLMEAATVLGACGIAYVMRFIRAMIQGGIQIGFDAETAKRIVAQTVKGSTELLIQNGSHPESEIDKVTTPKGCTIVGLNEMEHQGFSSSLIKGIVASYDKIGE